MNRSLEFDRWYAETHSTVLVAVSLACLGDFEAAEDATNDAFVKALERWDSVSQMDSPIGWVTRVAINRARRNARRRTRRIELLSAQRLETAVLDRYHDVDLWSSLRKLTARQREAIVLRYVADLSQAGVAAELGVATGTASATLSQARELLRTHLKPGDVYD